jgi:U2-associated protein SR140
MVRNFLSPLSFHSNSFVAGKRRDSRSRSASPRRRRRSRSRDRHKDDRSYSSSRSRSPSRSHDRYQDKKRRSSYRSQSRGRYRSSRYRSRSREEKQLTRDEEDFIELVGAKVRENGRDYEDMLLEREKGNPLFAFLFERRVCLHSADLQSCPDDG